MSSSVGNSGIFTLEEFYNRGIIKLAPDVLVYIGGSLQTQVVAPVSSSNNNISFNDGITTVAIQNNVDPPGSSTANIEIVTPIYGPNSNYWANYDTGGPEKVRAPIFMPMLEVKIYLKGRFLVDMKPRYYPAFWGFITSIDESYNGGIYKFNINCADMLHWWSYCSLNIHPVPETNIYVKGLQKLTPWSTIFETANPFNIIYSLICDMGMHDFVTPTWVGQKTSMNEAYPQDLFMKASQGIMTYWDNRLSKDNRANLLKMYGISGVRISKNGIVTEEPNTVVRNTAGKSNIKQATQTHNKKSYTVDDKFLSNFHVFADYDNMASFETAEYTTKLEVATEVKTRCNYEFYQDVNGNFIFKPPFYNINVKGLMPYTILPSDIISYSVNLDSEGIITVLNVTTPQDPLVRTTSYDQGQGFHMDIDLVKKYGVRFRNIPMEYINNADMARTLALGQMGQINAKTITGNVTVPCRPEIRLGYPIYMEHRDSFHYVKSINHSFDYGGSSTTTLSLETERQKVTSAAVFSNVPNAGQNKGRFGSLTATFIKRTNKNLVYKLVEPSVKKEDAPTQEKTGKKEQSTDKSSITTTPPTPVDPASSPKLTQKSQEEQRQAAFLGSKVMSNEQGRYEIVQDPSIKSTTTKAVPYSDEDGYRVVGSFPYGRNLNPILITNETADNGPSVYKDVYLTTMARPVYQNESSAMATLFFDAVEGAVPSYLNTEKGMPPILGRIEDQITNVQTKNDVDNVLTPDKQAQPIKAKKGSGVAPSRGGMEKIVSAKPTNFVSMPSAKPVLIGNIPTQWQW